MEQMSGPLKRRLFLFFNTGQSARNDTRQDRFFHNVLHQTESRPFFFMLSTHIVTVVPLLFLPQLFLQICFFFFTAVLRC